MEGLLAFARRATAKHDQAHDFDHAVTVHALATRIVAATGIDLEPRELAIFDYAMIGHDFRDHKIKESLSQEEITEFYTATVGAELAAHIVKIHENCSWSKRLRRQNCGEFERVLKILQDADWIQGMRLDRCIQYTDDTFPEYTDEQKRARIIEHIGEKLLKIPTELNFDASRKIAAELNYAAELDDYVKNGAPPSLQFHCKRAR